LVEKIITLENISLVDFLGVDNDNIKAVTDSFPKTKIVSRGNEIRIQGSGTEILRVNELFNSLVNHYNKFGKVTSSNVLTYIEQGSVAVEMGQEDTLIFGTRGAPIKAKTQNQKRFVDAVKKHDVVFAVGPAGTGKTYIAVALAVRALKNKEIKRIIITRPAVEAGENLGFLPGDLQEKIDPYLRPVYDALDDMIPGEKLKYYRENKVIEIAPLAYMRGRTLSNAFILLDEAQNTTPMQIKMFLTRMGLNSKLIINGDRTQVDLKPNQKSGLDDAMQILNNVKGIGFVELSEKDVVRHPVVREIIKAYDKFHGWKSD
jgi:phosphate starvation-inducible protein PhoH and related proteins